MFFTASHVVVHLLIALAYIVAVLNVPGSFASLIRIRRRTLIAGAGFFLFCGVTHFFLAVYESNVRAFVTVTDHLQAPSIIFFLIWLAQDVRNAVFRFRAGLDTIAKRYGTTIAREVRLILSDALAGVRTSDHAER